MKSREELVKEVEVLRRKLSPLEDKEFTQEFIKASADLDLMQYKRDFRGAKYVVLDPVVIWEEVYGGRPNKREVMKLGRTLQALLWEPSAINGNRVFVKSLEEFEDER